MTHAFSRALKAAAIAVVTFSAVPAWAQSHGAETPEQESWSFSGPLGRFDRAQLQRGFKVYREVCSSCHAMHLVSFRNLAEEGGPEFSEAQVKALSAEYKVQDGPNDSGEMFERPGRPSDRFPGPFANEQAARAANGGAYPPDFSLLAKARSYSRGFPLFVLDVVAQYQEHGVDYIHALLTHYDKPVPEGAHGQPGLHYNPVFPGGWIAMPKPINDGQVEYPDGTPTTIDQYSRDVASFMMWAAEPHLEARKRIGFQVIVFLLILVGLVYYTKKKVWHADVHHD